MVMGEFCACIDEGEVFVLNEGLVFINIVVGDKYLFYEYRYLYL